MKCISNNKTRIVVDGMFSLNGLGYNIIIIINIILYLYYIIIIINIIIIHIMMAGNE